MRPLSGEIVVLFRKCGGHATFWSDAKRRNTRPHRPASFFFSFSSLILWRVIHFSQNCIRNSRKRRIIFYKNEFTINELSIISGTTISPGRFLKKERSDHRLDRALYPIHSRTSKDTQLASPKMRCHLDIISNMQIYKDTVMKGFGGHTCDFSLSIDVGQTASEFRFLLKLVQNFCQDLFAFRTHAL